MGKYTLVEDAEDKAERLHALFRKLVLQEPRRG